MIHKHAVLIGIDKYPLLSNLNYAEADAQGFASALKSRYGFQDNEITLMKTDLAGIYQPTQRFIERQLRRMREMNVNLNYFFFGFWGHGFTGKDGKRYLCAIDTDEEELERTGISLESITSILSQIGSQNTCLILDCCQNVADGRGISSTLSEMEVDALSNGAQTMARDIIATRKKRGFSVTEVPTLAILNSCKAGQKAYEWDDRRHGIFTAHLLDAMENNCNSVTAWMDYISERVPRTAWELHHTQTPFFKLEGGGIIRLTVTSSSPANPQVPPVKPQSPESAMNVHEKSEPKKPQVPPNVKKPVSATPNAGFKDVALLSKTPFETTDAWKKRLEEYPRFQVGYGKFQLNACNADKNLFPVRFFVDDVYKNHIEGFKEVFGLIVPANIAKAIHLQTPQIPLTGTFTVNHSDWQITNFLFESGENRVDVSAQLIEAALRKAGHGITAGEKMTLIIKGINYTFRWCLPGTFMMGSPKNEKNRNKGETQHKVTLTQGFWMLECPVTQEMWESVIGNNPSNSKGGNLPVEQVSWDDCQKFLSEWNSLSGMPCGLKAKLPTEAQWEYACRAGTTGPYGGTGKLDEMGWYRRNSGNTTHSVKSKKPNNWGLYDMHGNVWEWCEDWYEDYPNNSVIDPVGPSFGSCRAIRGGFYCSDAQYCRCALRGRCDPEGHYDFIGFRFSLVPSSQAQK
ncbi:MAG: SUMF1/EgtB/PvdO family nonheme iron enzyme [Planctomycetia bacterium]|nr:SUMF1/EgtB/PvdO family nonheme iron enzyme [Planctomycetia bacterium]